MIRVDHHTPLAAYEQVRAQLSDQIRSGALESGTRLPSVRQLAGELGLAAGTIARACTELEKNGLVTTNRGGTRVAITQTVRAELLDAAAAYVVRTRAAPLDEALEAVRIQWAR